MIHKFPVLLFPEPQNLLHALYLVFIVAFSGKDRVRCAYSVSFRIENAYAIFKYLFLFIKPLLFF